MARVPINGTTLAWARAAMRLEPADIAKAAGTTLEKARGFESGEVEPTLKQLEKIAKKLDRTMAFFFTAPPAVVDVPDTPDFRGRGEEPLPPSWLGRCAAQSSIEMPCSTFRGSLSVSCGWGPSLGRRCKGVLSSCVRSSTFGGTLSRRCATCLVAWR